jgi:hypothetical protein
MSNQEEKVETSNGKLYILFPGLQSNFFLTYFSDCRFKLTLECPQSINPGVGSG